MVESRVSTGVLDNSESWFLFNPRGLLFISGWSWFSWTMGMLWVVFELIVAAVQTCPCCVNNTVLRVAHWFFLLSIVAQQVELQRYQNIYCFDVGIGTWGVVIGDKGLSLIFISYHFHLRMSEAGLFPPVRYFQRKPQELFRLSHKYPSLHVFSQISKLLL